MDIQDQVRVGEDGSVLIPEEIRRALEIEVGSVVTLRVIDGDLIISALRNSIRRAQERARHLVPPGTLVSDELSAERREEARRE
jgi:bifunctional DNA-binding transcriptional regulator/antitoxin component of YhaV-PrlF toxin-antitoxin module